LLQHVAESTNLRSSSRDRPCQRGSCLLPPFAGLLDLRRIHSFLQDAGLCMGGPFEGCHLSGPLLLLLLLLPG